MWLPKFGSPCVRCTSASSLSDTTTNADNSFREKLYYKTQYAGWGGTSGRRCRLWKAQVTLSVPGWMETGLFEKWHHGVDEGERSVGLQVDQGGCAARQTGPATDKSYLCLFRDRLSRFHVMKPCVSVWTVFPLISKCRVNYRDKLTLQSPGSRVAENRDWTGPNFS